MPHTPGPWTVHDIWNNNPCVENGGVFEIEEAHYDVKERLEAGSDVEGVIKGNARLIAQAPEMYELLKDVEYMQSEDWGYMACAWCGYERGSGHSSTCRLAAVLKAVEDKKCPLR
jgi:hypothetical protein